MINVLVLNFLILFIVSLVHFSDHIIIVRNLKRNSTIIQYDSEDSNFGPGIDLSERLIGFVVPYTPELGCSIGPPAPPSPSDNSTFNFQMFALIKRGNCSFVSKVRNAQSSGYFAVIVYDDYRDDLIPMGAGLNEDTSDIDIPSTFVGHSDGLHIKSLAYPSDFYFELIRNGGYTLDMILIPFLVVLVIGIVSILVGFSIRFCIEYRRRFANRLTRRHLKKIPLKKFVKGQDPYETCAICLEDYVDGDNIRILPCGHAFHSLKCIDPWLLRNRRSCPVCKSHIEIPNLPEDLARIDRELNNEEEQENRLMRSAAGELGPIAGATGTHSDPLDSMETAGEGEAGAGSCDNASTTLLVSMMSETQPLITTGGSSRKRCSDVSVNVHARSSPPSYGSNHSSNTSLFTKSTNSQDGVDNPAADFTGDVVDDGVAPTVIANSPPNNRETTVDSSNMNHVDC